MLKTATYTSPIGPLLLIADDHGLRAVLWPDDDLKRVGIDPDEPLAEQEDPGMDGPAADGSAVLADTARQLDEYFAGTRQRFDLPLHIAGTDFQQEAWQGLVAIPYGQTRSYGQQATAIGRPKAVRAIGAANGRNPLSIVVPCHRVVGADGSLTGFAGGVDTKRFLLEHEAAHRDG